MRYITSSEFGASIISQSACILPIGAYEQHGLHCVLETDCITADYIAERIGNMLNLPVLPTIPFGQSMIHRDFPGTIYVSDRAYECYLRDVFRSIKENGIHDLFLINGHGGNGPVIESVIKSEQTNAFKIHLFHWFDFIDDSLFTKEHRSHAGSMETSVVQAIDSHNIRNHLVEDGKKVENFSGKIQSSIKECTLNGIIGIASGHSSSKGMECIDMCCRKICDEIRRKRGGTNG